MNRGRFTNGGRSSPEKLSYRANRMICRQRPRNLTRLAQIWSVFEAVVLSRHFQPICVVPTSCFDQIAVLSAGESRLSASDPTSVLSGFLCNRSVVSVSFATLLLLTQFLVCCIHRLNPRSVPVTQESETTKAQCPELSLLAHQLIKGLGRNA